MKVGTGGAWWALALAEAVQGAKALPVVCEQAQLALFRNGDGQPCALEDRCPHRRVLLSPGPVIDGRLRCPYHGWTFDGNSGKCVDIPNLRRDERIGPKYAVPTYAVAERDGFIHVWRGEGTPDESALPACSLARRQHTGTAVASIAYEHYLDVMLDGIDRLLEFPGVLITDFYLGDPRRDGAGLMLDRGALWKGRGIGPAFVRDHPLLVRTRVPDAGGLITVSLLDADEVELATVAIGASENRRGTTSLCWRAAWEADVPRGAPLGWRLRRMAGKPPAIVKASIDGAALAALEVAPSLERRPARAARLTNTRSAA